MQIDIIDIFLKGTNRSNFHNIHSEAFTHGSLVKVLTIHSEAFTHGSLVKVLTMSAFNQGVR